MPENSHRQGIYQRVVLVNRVKPRFATDVGQAETVAVEADATDHTRRNPLGVGVI